MTSVSSILLALFDMRLTYEHLTKLNKKMSDRYNCILTECFFLLYMQMVTMMYFSIHNGHEQHT